MKKKLNDTTDAYDILFVDIPFLDIDTSNEALNNDISKYYKNTDITISNVTGIEFSEKRVYYSMGLLCLSSYIKKRIKGIRVGYINYSLNWDELKDKIASSRIIAFSTMTVTMPLIMDLIDKSKSINKNITVIMGGYHVTYYAEEILANNKNVDFIILKEGEEALFQYLAGTELCNIDGLAYRKSDGTIQLNQHKNYLSSCSIPTPDYELLSKYIPKLNIQLSTMRGCIGKCRFCVNNSYWGVPRLRNIKDIIKELRYLKKHLMRGAVIHIIDNIFTLNKKHLQSLLQGMRNADLTGYFYFECDTICSCIDPEIIELIRQIGVIKVCLGIEDIDDNILFRSNKISRYKENVKIAKLLKKQYPEICVYAYWIIGLPGSTKDSIERNLEAMKEALDSKIFDVISPKVFIPYPGTEFRENADEYGIFEISNDWNQYERRKPPYPYTYKYLTQEDLQHYLRLALKICS